MINLTNTKKVTIKTIMDSKAEIPKFDEQKEQFVSYHLEKQEVYNDTTVKTNFQGIFTSVVQAQKKDGNITIKMASVVNGNMTIDDFTFTYDFSLSTLGEPQINIYLLLTKPVALSEIIAESVTCNFYQIDFTNTIDLSEFNTVEIFLASEREGNPKPTRSVIANIFEV